MKTQLYTGLLSESNVKYEHSSNPQGAGLNDFQAYVTYKMNLSKYPRRHQLSEKSEWQNEGSLSLIKFLLDAHEARLQAKVPRSQ